MVRRTGTTAGRMSGMRYGGEGTVRMMRWIGRELGGMWRSMRYDLTRHPDPSRQRTEVLHPEYDAYQRPPRRWYAAAGLGVAVAAGVAATYVAVSGGLGVLPTPIFT